MSQRRAAGSDAAAGLTVLAAEVSACRACPRLVDWREEVARRRTRRFASEEYWGRPVPGYGDPAARVLLVGLAPGAHGANRTGRMFTGDASGAFLYPALHRAGFASRPEASGRDDGLVLRDLWITAPVRCAPPQNSPTPEEIARCRPFFAREWDLLPRLRVVLCLGRLAHGEVVRELRRRGALPPKGAPAFAHGAVHATGPYLLVDSYHVSQQVTRTGRLSPAAFDAVLASVQRLAQAPGA